MPPGQYPGQPYSQYPPTPPSSGKAVTALVLGLVGLLVCQLVGIAAIIVGRQARDEIAASRGALAGDGLAQAGVILGWVSLALMVLGIVFFVVFMAFGMALSGT